MNDNLGNILIVDDDPDMRDILTSFLRSEGYATAEASSATMALRVMQDSRIAGDREARFEPDLVLTDVKMGCIDGLELLARLRSDFPELPVILVTGYASIDYAVKAMRQGAYDYITKPFAFEQLGHAVRRALERRQLARENKILREEKKKSWGMGALIGKSDAMRKLFDLIPRVANCASNVLITGESGTGKELVARTIHQLGPRAHGPFIAINCAAIPESLLESELFGFVRGAFTGAVHDKKGLIREADGGILFLDEIGDMPLSLQAKLLRVLQDKEIRPIGEVDQQAVDVRVIAATHQDLRQMIHDRRFREDLYYRLSVIPIRLAPLRERPEDIPLLAEHFLCKHLASTSQSNQSGDRYGFTKGALAKLARCSWPGNVRELENVIERSLVLSECTQLTEDGILEPEAFHSRNVFESLTSDFPSLAELEERYVDLVLQKTGGRKDKAAAILGIHRRTLYRREKGDRIDPALDC